MCVFVCVYVCVCIYIYIYIYTASDNIQNKADILEILITGEACSYTLRSANSTHKCKVWTNTWRFVYTRIRFLRPIYLNYLILKICYLILTVLHLHV